MPFQIRSSISHPHQPQLKEDQEQKLLSQLQPITAEKQKEQSPKKQEPPKHEDRPRKQESPKKQEAPKPNPPPEKLEPGIDAAKTAIKAPISFLEVRRMLADDDDSDNFSNVSNVSNHSATNRTRVHKRSPEPVLTDAYVKNQMMVLQLERKQLLALLDNLDAAPIPVPTNASTNGLNNTNASAAGDADGAGNNNANATNTNGNANVSLADLNVAFYTLTDFYDQDDVTAEHLQTLQALMSLFGDDDGAANNSISNRNGSYVSKAMTRYFDQLDAREQMEQFNDNATENVWRKMEQLGLRRVNATLQAARNREQQIQQELASLQARIVAARKVRADEREAAMRRHQEAVMHCRVKSKLGVCNSGGQGDCECCTCKFERHS